MRAALVPFALLAAVLGHVAAKAEPVETKPVKPVPFMRTFGPAFPPYAFIDFCVRFEGECQPVGVSLDKRVDGSPEALAVLDRVNRSVNQKIKPATDLEVYGVVDYWTLPVDRGDCEDYALLKRHILIEKGWPSSALLMTVVRDEAGEGHAVLTARTAQGDYILDNKNNDLKLWYETPYNYLMRQSYLNPKTWVSLTTKDDEAPQTSINPRAEASPRAR